MVDLAKTHEELTQKINKELEENTPEIFVEGDKKIPVNRVLIEKINPEGNPITDNYRVTLNDVVLPMVKAVSVNLDTDTKLTTVTLTLYAEAEVRNNG